MDNGIIEPDYKLFKELAKLLGYQYNPYYHNYYLKQVINVLEELKSEKND